MISPINLRTYVVVSRGQTAISAQGVYRLQYKRPTLQGINALGGNSGLATRDYVHLIVETVYKQVYKLQARLKDLFRLKIASMDKVRLVVLFK